MARISIDRLGKDAAGPRRTTVRILGEVSLEVAEGELLVLVGPSGCGKTTLLRCIAGLEEVSRGELRFDGQRVNEVGPRERDVAMVFQSYALYPHLTVRDNLGFALTMRRTPREEIARRVAEVAAMLEIDHLLDRLPRQLSGGQRQRVAMGRAVVRRPRVFLFDEPLSNLDAALRGQMRLELKRLHARLAATMVYVTHDQVEAMTLADRIVLLRAGAVVQVGSPEELYRRPATLFAAKFFGTPEMNTVPGHVQPAERDQPGARFVATGGGLVVSGLLVTGRVGLDGALGEATLGVRAEDVRVVPPGAGLVDGEVEVLENLGADTLVHLVVGERRLVARVESSLAPPVGARVGVAFVAQGLHLFAGGEEGLRYEMAR